MDYKQIKEIPSDNEQSPVDPKTKIKKRMQQEGGGDQSMISNQ